MVRPRHQYTQLPAMTVLLLVLLATVPLFKVSSNSDTIDVRPVAQPAAATPIVLPSADAGAAVTAQRPVAQLIPPPDGLRSVAFTLGDGGAATILPRGATPVAAGRYTTSDHLIVVTTASLRTGGAPSSLGSQALVLPDGTPAWATPGLVGKAPNQVALVRDGLIVTVASDLPVETLATLASDVVIRW
jgi:hypothetical protein